MDNVSKHTPGPWHVYVPRRRGATYGIEGAEGEAVVFFGSNENEGIRRPADANLIAAAPDLFDALKDAIASLGGIDSDAVPESCRYALARATGARA